MHIDRRIKGIASIDRGDPAPQEHAPFSEASNPASAEYEDDFRFNHRLLSLRADLERYDAERADLNAAIQLSEATLVQQKTALEFQLRLRANLRRVRDALSAIPNTRNPQQRR